MARKYRQKRPELVQRFRKKNEHVESTVYTGPDIPEPEGLMGDVTGDGILDVVDLVELVGVVMGNQTLSDEEFILGDLNQDGLINVVDITALINLILTDGGE